MLSRAVSTALSAAGREAPHCYDMKFEMRPWLSCKHVAFARMSISSMATDDPPEPNLAADNATATAAASEIAAESTSGAEASVATAAADSTSGAEASVATAAAAAAGIPSTPVPSVPAVPIMPTVPSIPAPPSSAAYDPTLLLTVILSLLIPVLYIFRSSKKSSSRKLVIFGPVGGGKSAIYHRLRFGRVVPTVSSMTVTSATFVPNGLEGKPMHIVDVPGSGRLRAQLLEQVSDASALLCVLDGTQLSVQAREAAGVLFEVLSHEPVARRKLPVLVAVNKVDSPGAATPTAARKAIEQEVQRVRLARTTLSDTSGRDKKFSGIAEDDGRPFSFDHLETNTVVFAAISATKPELSAVHSLLKTLR